MVRLTWDAAWWRMAETIARRSGCERAQVGAVIVDTDNRILAVGYNGPPRGSDLICATCPYRNDTSTGYDKCWSNHAEVNAFSVVNRSECQQGTLYVTTSCCLGCAKLAISMGICRIIWNSTGAEHRDPQFVADFLSVHDVKVEDLAQLR